MPKDIDAGYVRYLFKPGIVLLTGYVFFLEPTGTGVGFVANNKDITATFTNLPTTYSALSIKRTQIRSEEGTVLNELEIGLDNVDLAFKNDVMLGTYNNKKCNILLMFVEPKTTVAVGYMTLFEGYVDEPKGDEHWVTFQIRPFSIFEREFPNRIFQVGCNWTFTDQNCGLNPSGYTVNTVLTSQSDGEVLTCSHGQAINYFVPGYVKITDGTYKNLYRPILANDGTSITLRVPFPFTIPNGTGLKCVKMCSRNPTACINIFNNYEEYGGFPHVPKAPLL